MIYLKKFTGMEGDFRFIGNRPIVVDLSAAVLISPEAISPRLDWCFAR
jgi:hypothetical protein